MTSQRKHDNAIVNVPIKDIKLLRNPKIHPEEQIADMVDSLKLYGFVDPCIISRHDNALLGGYCRLEASKRMGKTHLPCRFTDLKPEEYISYILSEHRVGEKGGVDYQIMIEWWTKEADELMRANVIGWSPEEVDDIIRIQDEQAQAVDLNLIDRPDEPMAPGASMVEILLSIPLSLWERSRVDIEGEIAAICLRHKGVKQSQPKVKQ